MTNLEKQISELSPSVKDALYRRLLFAEDLAWLRDEKKKGTVIGFEVDLNDQELSGFALIAIQRHTVIAFVSDRNEEPRLILFPALETLFDPGFELLNLVVTRKEFTDSAFSGTETGHGQFGDMVRDLTPPNRKVDISNTVLEQISNIIEDEEQKMESEPVVLNKPKTVSQEKQEKPKWQEEPTTEPIYEEPPEGFIEDGPPDGFIEEPDDFDDFTESGYNDYEDYGDYEEQPVQEPTRSEVLKSQTFSALSDVVDFVVTKQGVNRPLAVTLANKAMQSKVSPEYRVSLAVKIFCQLMDENKI